MLSVRAMAMAPQPINRASAIANVESKRDVLTCGHENAADDEQFLIPTPQQTQQPQNNTGTAQNAQTDGQTAQSDSHGIVVIDVEGLGGPEHDDGEEVGAGDEGDDERQSQRARFLLQPRREDGVFGAVDLPETKGNQEDCTENQWDEDMGSRPFILQSNVSKSASTGNPSDCCIDVPYSHPIAYPP